MLVWIKSLLQGPPGRILKDFDVEICTHVRLVPWCPHVSDFVSSVTAPVQQHVAKVAETITQNPYVIHVASPLLSIPLSQIYESQALTIPRLCLQLHSTQQSTNAKYLAMSQEWEVFMQKMPAVLVLARFTLLDAVKRLSRPTYRLQYQVRIVSMHGLSHTHAVV